jgi:hypothetical protein
MIVRCWKWPGFAMDSAIGSPPGTDAVVSWWVVDDAVGTDLERALGELVPLWLAES